MRNGLVDGLRRLDPRYRIDGFRIDTARHVERGFFVAGCRGSSRRRARPACRTSSCSARRSSPMRSSCPSTCATAGCRTCSTSRCRTRSPGSPGETPAPAESRRGCTTTTTSSRPSGERHVPPTFLGNHDIGRAAQQVRDKAAPGRAGCCCRDAARLRPALPAPRGAGRLLRRRVRDRRTRRRQGGAPRPLPDAGAGVAERGARRQRPPIGTGSSFDVASHPIAERLRVLGGLRAAHPVLSTGATIVRRATRAVLAVEPDRRGRPGASTSRSSTRAARRRGSRSRPRRRSPNGRALLGTTTPASSTRSGSLTLTIPPLSSCAAPGDPSDPGGEAAQAGAHGRARLAQRPRSRLRDAGARPVSVAFAMRRGNTARWTRIAADDSPPYRTFLDPAKFNRRERVYVVAIARSLDGRTALSAVRSFVPRR